MQLDRSDLTIPKHDWNNPLSFYGENRALWMNSTPCPLATFYMTKDAMGSAVIDLLVLCETNGE